MVLIETERLFIRHWVPDDWKRFRPLATDPRVLEFLATEPWSDERIQRFINRGIEVAQTRGWILWPVIHREDAELIGFCGFSDGFAPDVEIGWRFRPEYWGRGLATEAARAVMQYGFDTFGFERLISVPHPANRRSIRVMEKLGMTFEKTFMHQGIEVLCYTRTNPSRSGQQAKREEPREISQAKPMEIRPFQEADAEAVIALWSTVFAYPTPHNNPATAIRHKLSVQRELFFVALAGGAVVGTVMGGYDGHRGWIYSLAVCPPVRRQGIGTALMQHVEQELAARGCPKVNLQILTANAATVEFYKKLGYAVEERISMGKILTVGNEACIEAKTATGHSGGSP